MNMPVLGARLARIASRVRNNAMIADVGCDHAILTVYLLLTGKAASAVCIDINPNPLKKAESIIKRYGLTDKADTVLANGLESIGPGLANDIVIAGLGGETIVSIIESAEWLKESSKRLILQPMTKAAHLRAYLASAGFGIEFEDAAKEDGKLYTVITAAYDGISRELSDIERYVGKLPINNCDIANLYIQRTSERLQRIAQGLEKSAGMKSQAARYYDLANMLNALLIKKAQRNRKE